MEHTRPLIITDPEDICPGSIDRRGLELREHYYGMRNTTIYGEPCLPWSLIFSRPHRQHYPRNTCQNDDNDVAPWCYTNFDGTTGQLIDEYCFSPEPCDECAIAKNYLACHKIGLLCYDEDKFNENGKVVCLTNEEYMTTRPKTIEFDSNDPAGYEYSGTVNQTESGVTCQHWSLDQPHLTNVNYRALHNYCRNPDGSDRPWCYTTDPNIRWEYCAYTEPILTCDDNVCNQNEICMPSFTMALLLGDELSCLDIVEDMADIEEQFQNFYPDQIVVPNPPDSLPGSFLDSINSVRNADGLSNIETERPGMILYKNYELNKGVNIELGEARSLCKVVMVSTLDMVTFCSQLTRLLLELVILGNSRVYFSTVYHTCQRPSDNQLKRMGLFELLFRSSSQGLTYVTTCQVNNYMRDIPGTTDFKRRCDEKIPSINRIAVLIFECSIELSGLLIGNMNGPMRDDDVERGHAPSSSFEIPSKFNIRCAFLLVIVLLNIF